MKNTHGIIIFGANGSGKTTLARELARILGFKHIDHQDYVFSESKIPYANQRSHEECVNLMLSDINQCGSFVLSAVTGDFGEEILSKYDLAICITAPLKLRLKRIEQREYERYGERALIGGDMYESRLKFLDFVASRDLSIIEKWATTLICPVIHVDGTEDYKQTAVDIANLYTNRFISIGLQTFPDKAEIIRRVSARGVCIHDSKALMIKYKWLGYGFAGGGVEPGESAEETVICELSEEIGCAVTHVGKFLLNVTERTISESDPDKYFEQVNLYYECEVDSEKAYTPQPTPEEVDREYESVWVDLQEALRENAPIPQRKRDVAVLKLLLGGNAE